MGLVPQTPAADAPHVHSHQTSADAKGVFALRMVIQNCEEEMLEVRKKLAGAKERDTFNVAYRHELREDDFALSVEVG